MRGNNVVAGNGRLIVIIHSWVLAASQSSSDLLVKNC